MDEQIGLGTLPGVGRGTGQMDGGAALIGAGQEAPQSTEVPRLTGPTSSLTATTSLT